MVQTIPIIYLDKKKYPNIKKNFPKAKWMTMTNKYKSLSEAKRIITSKMVKRGYAKPLFEVIR